MPLDPEVEALLDPAAPAFESLTVEQARRQMAVASQGLNDLAPDLECALDLKADCGDRQLPVRLYRPLKNDGGTLVYFHGGGWVVGSVATHDGFCRHLAAASCSTVVSVDYRLAPEHRFPAAAMDARDVTAWVAREAGRLQVDPQRMAVGGDSAGGNLAAVAAILSRDRQGPPLVCQLLIYPIVDYDLESSSYHEFGDGYHLTAASMRWFWRHYVPEESDRIDPLASPLRSEDLRGLPAALVMTAEYDPLRDEGEAYARRLADCGVNVDLKRYDGMIHGFARRLRQIRVSRRALEDAAAFLNSQLRQ